MALYDIGANVLVLPVEAKPASHDLDQLVGSTQARGYATTFGGGRVLVTNLRSFAFGDAAGVVQGSVVHLATSEDDLDSEAGAHQLDAAADLLVLVDEATRSLGSLRSPKEVAWHLAWHARNMRDAIVATKDPDALLARISLAFKESLDIEIKSELLVPTVIQTIVYGLYAAWLEAPDPQDFDWRNAAYKLDVPVFAEILHEALSPHLVRELDLRPHLEGVARVLEHVDRTSFAAAYDAGAIEYFYEPFLAEFDTNLRDTLGVWYTPREVAEYQVARVDHHLRVDLGIADGLADESVIVLDPACGTGTYLAAILKLINQRFLDQNLPEAIAAARTRDAAITRVVGFEILPAAFVICHLHIQRRLAEMGAPLGPDERLRVFLTNSLTDWGEQPHEMHGSLFPELLEQVESARKFKYQAPVLAVVGNPPYQGYSKAESDEEKAMVKRWITPLWPV